MPGTLQELVNVAMTGQVDGWTDGWTVDRGLDSWLESLKDMTNYSALTKLPIQQ